METSFQFHIVKQHKSYWMVLESWEFIQGNQCRVQDLEEGGAKPIAREARAQKFKPRPKTLTTPPH